MAHNARIIPATIDHIAHIAANVRHADRLEFAANFRTAAQVMESGLKMSEVAWTGFVDDDPVCMFGVAPVGGVLPDYGRPWMVGTSKLDEHAIIFLRRCRSQVIEMWRRYPVLSNYVAASNTRTIEWLKWLGFTVSDTTIPVGIRGVPFHHFELRRES